jgi:hypothetical protein
LRDKPDKLSPDFQLYAQSSGQWAKKIHGTTHYFGTSDTPQAAEAAYRAFLDGEQKPTPNPVTRAPIPAAVGDRRRWRQRSPSTDETARANATGQTRLHRDLASGRHARRPRAPAATNRLPGSAFVRSPFSPHRSLVLGPLPLDDIPCKLVPLINKKRKGAGRNAPPQSALHIT